jgi:hypothetical protein
LDYFKRLILKKYKMKKGIVVIAFSMVCLSGKAQTGIGTTSPNASAKLDVFAIDKGLLPPRVTLTSGSDTTTISNPATGLLVYNTGNNVALQAGYYYWNGSSWATIATALGSSQNSAGDIKSGIQQTDHNGWIKLDGRAKTTLSVSQQARATALGIGANLPDASNAVLMQNGGALGSVSGSNSKTISQANLPNVTFNGTAASAGNHSHSIDPPNTFTTTNGNHNHYFDDSYYAENRGWGSNKFGAASNSDWDNDPYSYGHYTADAGNHSHTVDIAAFNSADSGSHSHTVTVISGGSGIGLDITPRSLSVNTFIYLGY